ncbi:MAG: hypothetical protein JEZ10_04240 [Verrucomicrobia bacterium]|nr:hypothetical protein [Verrucomicrobiota bacterium]
MKMCKGVMVLAVMALFAGCSGGGSGGVDENKPIGQVATEAAAMGQAELQKMVDKYESVIADKVSELEALKEKVKEIPMTELMGEKAKALKADLGEITASLSKLKDQLSVYAKELAAK